MKFSLYKIKDVCFRKTIPHLDRMTIKIRRISIISIICITCLALYSSVTYAQPQKLRVLLDWFANPNHAPLFVAEEKGFFKQEGFDVELIGPADPNDPPKLVAANKADIAITYQPQFMQQIDRGLPLIRIGTLIDKPLNCLVILKEGSIKSIKDLRFKRVGYSGDTNSVTLKNMLGKNNIPTSEVEFINVHYDLTQALLSKKVAAVTGMMRNFELIQLELSGHPGIAFYPEKNGIPNYSELIFVANSNHLDPLKFRKFIRAVKHGVDYLEQHPTESWQLFIHKHPELNDELNKRAWFATLPYFAKDPASYNENEWLMFGNFLLKNGLVKKVQPINHYVLLA